MIVTDLFESAPEQGMAEYSLNELSSDLLQKSAQVAKNKSRQAMDPNIHDALGGGYMNPLAKHYDSLSQKFNDKAVKVGQRDAVKKIASPAVMRKIGMIEQGMAEAHGNYAGDTPVNLGGVSMKMIQAGDTVKYIDQQAQVVDMSPDRKYSRITIPSSSTTKTVLTSDLKQLGQGVSEADDEQLDEFNLKDLGSKIFGSRPNTNANAAPGSLSPPSSAHIPNPATGKPYTQAEIRALAAQKAAAAKAAASTEPAAPTPPAAPNPFGQMANQLQNYKTSTGGQVRGTTTGLKHTASPDNPNAMPAAAPAAPAAPAPAAPVVKRSVKSSVRPNFAPQNAGYKSVNYAPNVKTGAAMPKPFGVPTARSATRVTSGGPTADEKAKLARRIAQAVKEPVAEMLKMVETKEDVQRIKKFIDDTFVKHGAVNESTFALRNQILEHVTQVGAQRRRDFAAQRTH